MTDLIEPRQGSQIDADGVSTDSGTPGTPEADTGAQRPNREARYRTERNTAREELAAANARIAQMQRAEVERIASEHLAQGADLLTMSGNELAAYLDDETGAVDAERIREDARLLLEERPGLGKHAPAFDPTQGTGGPPKPKPPTPSWGSMFQSGVSPAPQFTTR